MTPPNGANSTAVIDNGNGIATAHNASSIKAENPLLRSWSDQPFHLPPQFVPSILLLRLKWPCRLT
jgi:hypothetical protein